MEELIIAIIVVGMFYAILRFFKLSWVKQAFPPSFIYLAGVFAWCASLAAVATVYSLLSVLLDLISTFDSDTLVGLIIFLAIVGIASKILVDRKDVLDIKHMIPFLRAAIFFQPYDARRQELFERNERMQLAEAQRAAAERVASGQPAEETLDISEEGSKDGAGSSQSGQPTAVATEIDILKRGEGVDISEIFKSKTAKMPAHPFYGYVSLMRIDPADKRMKFNMLFPTSATEPELTPDKLQRVKQGVYQVLQTFVAEQWLKPYSAFYISISVNCLRSKKDEFDLVRESTFMSIQMSTDQLRQSRGKPFNAAEFAKIATITMAE